MCVIFWLVQALPQLANVWREMRLLKGRGSPDPGQEGKARTEMGRGLG